MSSLSEYALISNPNRLDSRGDGEVTRLGAGESYRPNPRPRSPRADTFRSDRDRDRSPRRDRRTPPLSSDSYHPGARDRSPRRRSRTPPYRARDRSPARDMNWRSRARSPIRARSPLRTRSPRRYSPRRDDDRRDRVRSPRRDDRSRSPYDRDRAPPRARSPLPSRRSPPPGPRGSWRGRSRTPDRRDIRTPIGPSSQGWRRRSPSPVRRRSPSPIRRRSPSPAPRDSERSSVRSSGSNSRRSSPPVHPSRQALTQAASRDSRRSPPPRDRSPGVLAYRQREQESARSTPKERSPARPIAPRSPPRGPAASFRAPTGPSSSRNFTTPIPSGPSSYNSSQNRTETNGPVVPPSGPRGYVPPRGPAASMRGGRSSFSAERHSRPDTSSWPQAPPSRPSADLNPKPISHSTRPPPSVSPSPAAATPPAIPTGPSGIPTGPRAGTTIPTRPSNYHGRGSVSGPSSGPRIHPAMIGITPIIPGGRIDPTASGIPADVAARLKKKEEEAEVLREELKQKQEKLRKGLKTWDRLSRESQSMGHKSELSERHVRLLAGEGVGGKAF
ncbi:serine arginine repetitive matrix 1 protein [Rutstroemia sp. NJR-2017a BBW]|nr:serine arginine repetitive matrix 1 protein [Rutstroemia sp. NJR-2017a BBW]